MDFDPLPHFLGIALIQEAHSASPEEMCGFLVDLGGWGYLPVPNCHSEPNGNFSMEESRMLEILTDNDHKVLGIYHSHPKGNKYPSENDQDLMRLYSHLRFWIVTYNNVYEWRIEDDKCCPVRRDGSTGLGGMAYPLLAPAAAV